MREAQAPPTEFSLPSPLPSFASLPLSVSNPELFLSPSPHLPVSLSHPTELTFGSLTLPESGAFIVPAEIVEFLGYDPSFRWYPGQSLDEILTLGDVSELGLERLSLERIGQLAGIDVTAFRLSEFGVLPFQTLGDLIDAMPHLSDYRIADLLPIAELLQTYGVSFVAENTLADILQTPELLALPLSAIDLQRHALSGLPGIETVAIERFRHFERTPIAQIPALNRVPLGNLLSGVPTPSRVDIVFGTAEGNRTATVSGSYQDGFNVPCFSDCAHLELGDPFEGWQWISGKYQQVNGGFGALAAVNGGKEPTGRHPFGDAFKVAVWETDEASGTAEQRLYFRICLELLGCTPYFIPVPWIPVEEEGWTVL